MKIKNKITLSFLLSGIVLTIAASSVFYFMSKSQLQQEIESKLSILVHSRTETIESYLRMLEVSVMQLSKSVVFEDFLKALDEKSPDMAVSFEKTMRRLTATKDANPSIYEFLLLDKQGQVVASSNALNIGLDKSTDAFFLGGRAGVYIKDAYFSESTKTSLIAVSAPCLSSEGNQLLGVIVARVKLDDLNNIVANIENLGNTGETYIINKYGFMITPSRFMEDTFLKKKIDTENVKHARLAVFRAYSGYDQSEIKTTKVFSDHRGVLVLGDHDYIPKMQWIVVAEVDTKEAFAPLAAIRMLSMLLVILVCVCVIILSKIIAKTITYPINELNKAVKKIGKGDLNYRINNPDKDEMGDVSRAFDHMLSDLKNSTVSIENLNKEIANRKKIEQALSESREYLSTTLNSVGDGLIAVDINSKITFINPVAQGLTGWQSGEAIGRHIDEVFVIKKEGTEEKADNPVLRVLSDGKIAKLANHTILVSKDSFIFAIDDSAAPIIDPETKKIIGVVLVFRDVTERNRIEKELRQLSLAVEQSPACVVITDIKGNIEYINPKFSQLTGYSSHEAIGQNPRILKSGEQPDSYYKELWDTVTSGKEWRGEFHNKKKNGQLYWERALISPMHDKEGVIKGFIGIKEDITFHKQAEESLLESQRRYEQLARQSRTFNWEVDINGLYTYVSPVAKDVIDYEPDELVGKKHFYDICPEAEREKIKQEGLAIMKRKEPLFYWENQLVAKNGNVLWVSSNGLPLLNANGECIGFRGSDSDITERKLAQEQIQHAIQMQMEFTSTVSHELRTPLTAIKEGIAIVLDGSAGDINDEQKDFLDTAKRNVDRLTRLINDVLDFQKLKSGKAQFNKEPGNVNETIVDVHKQMIPEAKKKGLDFILQLDKAMPNIKFDHDAIMRVIINLVNNAFKFTDKGSVIITTEQRPDENLVYIKVIDTGHGIKDSDLGLLFEDFQQLEKGKDRKTGGTGLGLAISKRIIAQHGGKIWAESEVGKGASFIFVLPIVERRGARG
jgi:PAS domain S-box-containing protein